MADRKQTPDILGEIMGDISGPAAVQIPAPVKTVRKGPKSASQPAAKKASMKASAPRGFEKKAGWEYRLVSFQDHRGWRARYVNGEEIDDWTSGPLLYEYITELGQEGWEIAAASAGECLYGSADRRQIYFKRAMK